jgi:DNA anti-recombination protein RmuC
MNDQQTFSQITDVILSNDITLGFSAAIGFIFVLAIFSHISHSSDNGLLSKTAPTILTSLGVLGTFLGIFLGLLEFNVDKIDKSVPILLSGLKIAFITSILGMLGAIALKIIQSFFPRKGDTGEIGAEHILSVLEEIRDGDHEALDQIRKAIADDSDSSLVTQIQKMRTSMADGQNDLKSSIIEGFAGMEVKFTEFAETMAENNSKALVEALDGLIRDFNTQLNEQFGENFKQLNEAVGALLVWQEHYKDQIVEIGDQFNRSLEGIEASEQSLSTIAETASSIPETMSGLADLMVKLNIQVDDMESRLEAFANLKDKASEAFPLIEDKLEQCTSGLANAVSIFVSSMDESLDAQRGALGELEKGFEGLGDETREAVRRVSDTVDESVKGLSKNMEDILQDQSASMQAVVEQIHEGFRKAIADSNEVLGKQIAELDQQMQDEVKRVVEVMGGHLGSLSAKFVEDYEPLTDKLRSIVRMAEAA